MSDPGRIGDVEGPPAGDTRAGPRGGRPPGEAGARPSSPFLPAREQSPTRRRILEVAGALFTSRGYERTPLRAISDALGVTKAALYHHYKAKDDLLDAIVTPVLDRIDELLERVGGPGRGLVGGDGRRDFLSGYVDELIDHAGIVALLLRDPAVGEHAVGRRFADQHVRMRALLGPTHQPEGLIRTSAALWALELAVAEFGDIHPAQLRDTVLSMAIAVLDSGPPAAD